jgi:microsomal dipeptidase-like Zn-dependent dipeptidase
LGDDPGPHQIQVDLPKMQRGLLDAVFMAAYLEQGPRDAETLRRTVKKTETIIQCIVNQIEKNDAKMGLARSSSDLKRLKREGRKAIFICIENGYGLGNDLDNVQKFYQSGVRYLTLCHNGDNDLCDSAVNSSLEHNGLSAFGGEVVREMNRVGMMVDISHVSVKTAFDVLRISSAPVIASHSSAQALCRHSRNIPDALLQAIAANGGVVQVCIYPPFLRDEGLATVADVVRHIEHIISVAGIDHVGIASDFDGGGGIHGLASAADLPKITAELLRRQYSETEIAKIWGGNLMRVMDRVATHS